MSTQLDKEKLKPYLRWCNLVKLKGRQDQVDIIDSINENWHNFAEVLFVLDKVLCNNATVK